MGAVTRHYILILYTTLYREGGAKFQRAAKTLAAEKATQFPGNEIICAAVENKDEFLKAIAAIRAQKGMIAELHFIGHSGMYGIMFGTRNWPEQFSPFEWRNMRIPFTPTAKFYLHACRSGRWLAPFLARTFQVKTFGYHWYTTVSRSPNFFRWDRAASKHTDNLFIISCPGKKSHGLLGTISKFSGFSKAYPFLEFNPSTEEVDDTYDDVAELYDETFSDIKIRRTEWNWVKTNLEQFAAPRVLDIGCGNGELLRELSRTIKIGVGVDRSAKMIACAQKRAEQCHNLSFQQITGPHLPFEDNSFDVVLSLLSFRYLDWDPILNEVLRVLKPGGELLILDMVAAPVKFKEWLQFLRNKLQNIVQHYRNPGFARVLKRMIHDPRWQRMLKYNPIRAEHELTWYLESRFPGRKVQVLDIAWSSRILAFRSGPLRTKSIEKLSYP